MAEIKKHIAGRGAKAGQWVTCNAKNKCRLGGQHISEQTFYAARVWLDEKGVQKNFSEITQKDVNDFLAAGVDPIEYGQKASELARQHKGLEVGVNPFDTSYMQNIYGGHGSREEAIAAGNARAAALKAKTTKPAARSEVAKPVAKSAPVAAKTLTFSLNNYNVSRAQWDAIVKQAEADGVSLKLQDQESAQYVGYAEPVYTLKGLEVKGPKDKVDAILARLDAADAVNPRVEEYGSGTLSPESWKDIHDYAEKHGVSIGHDGYRVVKFLGGLAGRKVQVRNFSLVGTPDALEIVGDYFERIKNL